MLRYCTTKLKCQPNYALALFIRGVKLWKSELLPTKNQIVTFAPSKVTKKTSYAGLGITYWAWKCAKCGKEYLETDQSKKLRKIWTLQMLMEGKAPTMERSLNYDGKTYFVRFPKDLTSGWKGKEKARMTMLTPEKYLVEIV